MDVPTFVMLQNEFKMLHKLCANAYKDEKKISEAVENIKCIRKEILADFHKKDTKSILYCIDILLEFLDKGDYKMAADFAYTVKEVPEIYMGKRDIYSLAQKIVAFREQYGENYFSGFLKLKPKFQKKSPHNKKDYFSLLSDENFKSIHPIAYKILCCLGIAVFLLPMIIFISFVIFVNPAKESWMMAVGAVGAMALGIGFFNIVAAWLHQYLGHLLTFVSVFFGMILMIISFIYLYN